MKITKRVCAHDIEIELDEIKSYDRFTLYQVSKLVNGVKVPLYKECFTDLQINKIIANDYRIDDRTYYTDLDRIEGIFDNPLEELLEV